MIETKVYYSITSEQPLCETKSSDNYCLLQNETGIVYGSTAIDTIAGYNKDGTPFSRFTYSETDIKDKEHGDEG